MLSIYEHNSIKFNIYLRNKA